MIRTYIGMFISIKIIMKCMSGYIIRTQTSRISSYINTISQFIISNGFYIVMQDRTSVFSGSIISKCTLFPIQTVNSSTIRSNPQIMIFIFYHLSYQRKIQTIIIAFIVRIIFKDIFFLIEIVHSTIIGSYPERSLPVFIK